MKLKTLKKKRLEMGVTQKKLARELGCSIQFYSQMERGINVLSYENAVILANYFEVSPDELFLDDCRDFLKLKNRS